MVSLLYLHAVHRQQGQGTTLLVCALLCKPFRCMVPGAVQLHGRAAQPRTIWGLKLQAMQARAACQGQSSALLEVS